MVKNGIFCLEGDWWQNLKNPTSVVPILELLHQKDICGLKYIYKSVGTKEEYKYYLGKWTLKMHNDYPILYLGFHGAPGVIYINNKRNDDGRITLDEIEEMLRGKCKKRIIYFASCSTIDLHGRRLHRFIKETGALALCGYRKPIEWLEAASFELIVMYSMQNHSLTIRGVKAMDNIIKKYNPFYYKKLAFRMIPKKQKY